MAFVAVDLHGHEEVYRNRPIRLNNGYWWDNVDEESEILISKGTIEKIIGRALTWDDEPVEI